MRRAGPGFRRARRDPRAGAPSGRAVPGEGDLARLRAGTYTGPLALDLLLGALPGRAVVLEGHTSSRNVGGADIDWEDRRRAAPHLGPAAGRRIPAADRVGGGDRPARGPVPERDRGVVGRRLCAGRGRPGRARRRRAPESGAGRISSPRP